MRKRIAELKALISNSLEAFAAKDQKDLLADLFIFYYNEHAKKAEDFDEFFYEKALYSLEKGSRQRMQLTFQRIIDSNVLDIARFEIPNALAEQLLVDGKAHEAYLYFNRARNVQRSIEMTRRFMEEGNKGEQDLFIARIILAYVARKELERAKEISTAFMHEKRTPILNFCNMVIDLIELGEKGLFVELVREKYAQSIKRDPQIISYLEKISDNYFGGVALQEKKQGLGELLSSMLSQN